MAKITALAIADALTGDEHLPIVQGAATKRVTMSAFRDLITPFLQYWYKGDRGDTGPANSTFATKAALQAASVTNRSYHFAPDENDTSGFGEAVYFFKAGNFGGATADFVTGNKVALNGVAITAGALLKQGSTAIAHGAADVSRSLSRTLAYYGVPDNSGEDETASINAAFAQAKADGVRMLLASPHGYYRHAADLYLDSVVFDAQGADFEAMSTDHGAFHLTGNRAGMRHARLIGTANTRGTQLGHCGLVVTAADFAIDNVEIVGAGGDLGFAGAGAMFFGAKRGVIRNLRVEDPHADGIHVTYGCEDLDFYSGGAIRAGDDSFAVVSYRGDGMICRNIRTDGLSLSEGGSRGISIVGGIGIKHYRPTIYRTAAAAIYVVSETSYDTYGARDWCVRDFYAEGCVTGIGLDAGFLQAAILVQGRDGTASSNSDGVVPLDVTDGVLSGRIRGIGARASAALITNNVYVRRLRYELRLEEIRGPSSGYATLLGGENCSGWIDVAGCDGIPFILSSAMVGYHAYDRFTGIQTRLAGYDNPNNIHGDGAQNFNDLRIDLIHFANAPGDAIGGDFNRAKTSWRKFQFNDVNIATG